MSAEQKHHCKAYVCIHIFQKERPVLLVNREGEDWAFVCGEPHEDSPSQYRVVGIGHVLDSDPTLHFLSDLPPDWEAERQSVGAHWVRTPLSASTD